MVNITKTFLTKLNKDPIKVLDSLSEEEIVHIIQKANYEYRNNKNTIMTDDMFDLIKDYLEIKNPNHPILTSIGASVVGDKVELPYFMGSLDKIKSDDRLLDKFKQTYTCSYIISDKLDGNSAMFYIDKDGSPKLFTRGDGTYGQDVSHLLPFINNIPKSTLNKGYAIRGELIISRKDFQTVSTKGANARNMVAGILNAKIPDLQTAKLVQFVAYELVNPKEVPESQMQTMSNLGFKVVHRVIISDHMLSNNYLSDFLIDRRKNSEFEVDGIVVMHNGSHNRIKENPKHGFAFKSVQTMEKAEVVVTHIDWNLSKDGYMIPVVNFNAVHLAGVMIQKANGFNGKYIKDNKLGPGSRIIIMRSGDVIPYIVEVLSTSATGNPSMPDIDYEWSKTGVDIIAKKENNSEVEDTLKLKNIIYFFDKLDIKGVSGGTITKIYNAGYKDIKSIISISKDQLLQIDGFQEKSAQNTYDALKNGIKSVDCIKLMDASNTLGRGMGAKKIETIISAIPTILSSRYIPKVDELTTIKGIENKTAELFIKNLPIFFRFYEETGITCLNESAIAANVIESDRLKDVTIVFTGFRNKELEEYIIKNGGIVSGSISKKTNILLVKDKQGKESGKVAKVKEIEEKHNVKIRILTMDEFKKEINI